MSKRKAESDDRDGAATAAVQVTARPLVVGLGVACVDMIATVQQYPRPDEKIRAVEVDLYSGGNIGNTLTAISRLGAADTKVVTKIGDDSHGALVRRDFAAAGVDTSEVVVASDGAPTLLVYVIADQQTATRTCIAAPPKAEVEPHEVLAKRDALLDGAALVHLDSRHTAAAVALAAEANRRGVPVAVDVEKDRPPHLQTLLPLCDLVFTNESFPVAFFGSGEDGDGDGDEDDSSDDMLRTLRSMTRFFGPGSRTSVVVTTRGEHGALLVRKRGTPPSPSSSSSSTQSSRPPTTSCKGAVDRQLVNALCGPLNVQRHVLAGSQTLQLRPAAASSGTDDPDSDADAAYDVLSCSAWPLQPGDLVDSTGAGDAFIGGFLSAWVTGLGDDASCLALATTVAAAKLRKKGAREGLPTAEEVNGRIHDLLRRATERDVT